MSIFFLSYCADKPLSVWFSCVVYVRHKHRFDPDCGVLYKLLLNRLLIDPI